MDGPGLVAGILGSRDAGIGERDSLLARFVDDMMMLSWRWAVCLHAARRYCLSAPRPCGQTDACAASRHVNRHGFLVGRIWLPIRKCIVQGKGISLSMYLSMDTCASIDSYAKMRVCV